jgi:hypothetical protein
MPVRVGGRAAAFLVAEAGVEAGCLEGVGAQGYLVAAAAGDLLFGGGQELGAQATPPVVGRFITRGGRSPAARSGTARRLAVPLRAAWFLRCLC